MDVSLETPKNPYRKPQNLPSSSCQTIDDADIIDISKLNLNDDENWLIEAPNISATDLEKWLYSCEEEEHPKLLKNIDTRTFTRPKKRFTRPSIEKYNEELYGSDLNTSLTDSGIQLNGFSQDDQPVQFDLAQPVSNSYYFDNILATGGAMVDSFQNMSPPSLVNSMCSSTFANLMENSFIKNDPVLREIRDTDYTGVVLQQECEPMFQSITESCSSLNSELTENLLKKISFSEKNLSDDPVVILNRTGNKEDDSNEDTLNLDGTVLTVEKSLNNTFIKQDSSSKETIILEDNEAKILNSTFNQRLNGTYKAPSKSTNVLNNTFQRRKSTVPRNQEIAQDLNTTVTIGERPIENVKRLLDRRPSPSLDLNRISYQPTEQLNQSFEKNKRNSLESSDSTENLDYMSLSSSSSKSSNAMNEQSLQQVMSTPKVCRDTLWQNIDISPIGARNNSDPELSSTEKTIEKRPVIVTSAIKKQRSTSTSNIASKMPQPPPRRTAQRTNLNSMGHTLKGSYTSLKPMNPNLPVAPPPLDTTVTLPKAMAQVAPLLRESALKTENAQFVRPQPFRSGLPRPVTGIPRPVSRIPGPRGVRPVSKSAGLQGRQT